MFDWREKLVIGETSLKPLQACENFKSNWQQIFYGAVILVAQTNALQNKLKSFSRKTNLANEKINNRTIQFEYYRIQFQNVQLQKNFIESFIESFHKFCINFKLQNLIKFSLTSSKKNKIDVFIRNRRT